MKKLTISKNCKRFPAQYTNVNHKKITSDASEKNNVHNALHMQTNYWILNSNLDQVGLISVQQNLSNPVKNSNLHWPWEVIQ